MQPHSRRPHWKDCPVMPPSPVAHRWTWDECVAWLAIVEVPPGEVRVSRCTVIAEPERHLAYLKSRVGSATSQDRVGIWRAMERLRAALEGAD